MWNRRFLIYQRTPPDLAKGQIEKTIFQTCDLFFMPLKLDYPEKFYWGYSFEQLRYYFPPVIASDGRGD